MRYSVALTERINDDLLAHLVRSDGQEDLIFALWMPSYGRSKTTAMLRRLAPPKSGEREVHGNVTFLPEYVERLIAEAISEGCGIALLHSHPSSGWQGLSAADAAAERLLAPTIKGATGLPLVALTLGAIDGVWSARFWEKISAGTYELRWCETVRVVGSRLKLHFCDHLAPRPELRLTQIRTVSAWGEQAQADLARLRIGIVGLGSVGSIIAESLSRMGVKHLDFIDFDTLKEHNLDRTLNASAADTRRRRAKVHIAARAARRNATARGFHADVYEYSVCEEIGYRAALDCDVLFSCVDRPWGRSVLNFIAYAHLIPVVDGGIRASQTRSGQLRGADWKAHVSGPSHACLQCLGQYDPGLIAAEKAGNLDDPHYIETLPEGHLARARENVFAFSVSLAGLEMTQLLMLTISPLDLGPSGAQNYHLLTGAIDIGPHSCETGCPFNDLVATGDLSHSGIDQCLAAETEREFRAARKRNSLRTTLRFALHLKQLLRFLLRA